jgi:hypothetical protein
MRFEVPFLPPRGAEVQGRTWREGGEYNAVLSSLAAEVASSAPPCETPFERAHLTIVAFIGSGREEYFRPRSPRRLWPALDGVFDGLQQANIILASENAPAVTTYVVTGSKKEGLQITIEELP